VCAKCDFDLCKSPRYPPVIGTIGFQTKINRIIETERWRGEHLSYEYFDILYQLLKFLRSESKVFDTFNSLITSSEGLRVSKLSTEKDFGKISTVEREHLLRIATWILECWPDRFIELCKAVNLSTYSVLKDRKSLPTWFRTLAQKQLHLLSASEKSILKKKHNE